MTAFFEIWNPGGLDEQNTAKTENSDIALGSIFRP